MKCIFYTLPILLLSTSAITAETRLDTLFELGDSAIAIEWTPDSTNTRISWYQQYGSGCTGEDSIYRHCDFLPGVTYHSIAYSYGGEDSYPRFREKVADGYLVGSHLCHYNTFGDPSNAVAGTDCSGFVCCLWGVPRVSTRELYSQYTVITRDQLDAGDILVKPGSHAVLVIEHEEGTRYLIWESTSAVNGCRERSIDIADTYWDAYSPRRYEGLTIGIISTPKIILPAGFPEIASMRRTLTLKADLPWSGTMSVFAVNGKLLRTTVVELASHESLEVPSDFENSVAVVRLYSRNGSVSTTVLPALR